MEGGLRSETAPAKHQLKSNLSDREVRLVVNVGQGQQTSGVPVHEEEGTDTTPSQGSTFHTWVHGKSAIRYYVLGHDDEQRAASKDRATMSCLL